MPLCLLLLCISANTPDFARASIQRAAAEYTRYGAKLPRIAFKWVDADKPVVLGYANVQKRRKGRYVIFLNARDFTWPRAEVSLDLIYLHEIGHCLGWDHQEADSVMEEVAREHLRKGDIARLGGSQ